MKPGPKPKSTRLKIVDAPPDRGRPADQSPQPHRGRPTLPGWLSYEAKLEWGRVVPELDHMGLLCKVDRAALAAYCQAWAELRLATETLEREGRTYAGPNGILKMHPAVTLQKLALATVRAYLNEFGLSPSSRSGLAAPARADDDPLGDFLKEAQGG
jgi:P27 family predicted phage terminase small subunit